MKIDMEYRKGILFIRIKGSLTRKYINKFENEILPIVLKQGMKYIVINLENLNEIDNYGLETLSNLYEIIKRNKGRTSLCNVSDYIKERIKSSDLCEKYFNTNNELTALELFKL